MKFNDRELRILRRAYVDYINLERLLNVEFGETTNINKVYEYIEELKHQRYLGYNIDFTNVELDEGFFDFNYNDMCLSISVYNTRNIVKLCDSIEVWDVCNWYLDYCDGSMDAEKLLELIGD